MLGKIWNIQKFSIENFASYSFLHAQGSMAFSIFTAHIPNTL